MVISEFFKNKFFVVLLSIFILNVVFVVGGDLVLEKIANKVITKLQKEYSPSPYGPGVDPDKINFGTNYKVVTNGRGLVQSTIDRNWLNSWEEERGFNP